MGWGKVAALALGALVVAAAVEAHVGSTRYELNGAAYAVPHKYEFMRNFSTSSVLVSPALEYRFRR